MVYGLNAIINANNSVSYSLVKLTKDGKLSKIEEYGTQIELIKIKELVLPKIPIALVISGKGISTKKINYKLNDGYEEMLNKALPNAKLSDFIIERFSVDDENIIVTITRQDAFLNILETLNSAGITSFFSIHIGTLIINNSLPLLISQIENDVFNFLNYDYALKNNSIHAINANIQLSNNKIKIAEDEIHDYSLLAFSACLEYYISNNSFKTNSDKINFIKSEFAQKETFVFRLWLLLGSSLFILLVNFFVFNFYWQKNLNMNSNIQVRESALNKLSELKLEYTNKMEFVNSNGLLENSKTSFYADRLAQGLTENINLTNIIIYPAKEKKDSYEEGIPEFDSKKINVKGSCEKSIELNFWMKKIQKYSWIKSVQLINYTQESASDKAKFFLEIVIK